ncbi:MAG: GvpL/GvpF family gas vesicle protein, partial [Candidatus Cloacimonadales bacterium]|nr:GvpL/GvpF family gas vesicle protein [Candidatus Cloacimonadales bacterium]
ALEKEKEMFKKKILDTLSPLAVKVKDNYTYGERMIINSAFLIKKDIEDEFDKKMNKLDEEYGNIIKFKYVVTIPPFNFVNLIIQTKGF